LSNKHSQIDGLTDQLSDDSNFHKLGYKDQDIDTNWLKEKTNYKTNLPMK